ncbi:MAG TPA: cell envelope biogenesis protein OmpA, partial [Algoriphagus sp.]|nr:cell envelope biogenesis protein OmpA [Algoriphagus sp.]
MKNSLILSGILSASVLVSCVSKKKYTELESNLFKTQTELAMTNQEKAELEEKMAAIEARVAEYNARINSLRDTNDALTQSNNSLYSIESGTVMSKNSKQKMAETLAKVDPDKLAQAKTLEDSVNLAVEYNLKQNITENTGGEED